MSRKFISVILAFLILLMPMAALAEGEAQFAKLTISDPAIDINEAIKVDMTGLGVVLTSAYDLKDSDNPAATVTAQVLANGVEALGAAIGVNKDKAVGVLNGLQKAYGINFAEAVSDYQFDPAMVEDFLNAFSGKIEPAAEAELAKDLESIFPMEEKGEEEIEFRGEKVTAKVYTVSLKEKEYADLIVKIYGALGIEEEMIRTFLNEANLSMTGDFTFYEVDENRVYMEGVYTVKETTAPFGGLTRNRMYSSTLETRCYMKMSVVSTGENDVDMQMDMDMQPVGTQVSGDDSAKMTMSMVSKESDAFEDAVAVTMTMNMTAGTNNEEVMTMAVDVTPQAMENGWQYDYAFDMDVPNEAHINLSGKAMVDGENVLFTLALGDMYAPEESGDMFNVMLEGKYSETADTYNFDGVASMSVNAEGMAVRFSANVAIETMASVEGKILNIESIDAVDANNMTESELEALNEEATTLMLGVSEKLMAIPGLKMIIESGMSDLIPEVTEAPVAEVG